MDDVTPIRDVDSLDEFLEVAEDAGGTLAVTKDGRLVVYGVKEPLNVARRMNAPGSGSPLYVKAMPGGTLTFDMEGPG